MIQSVGNNIQTSSSQGNQLLEMLKPELGKGKILRMPNVVDNFLLDGGERQSQQKISLSPRQFADIITESIGKVLQNVLAVFLEKISSMFGQAALAKEATSNTQAIDSTSTPAPATTSQETQPSSAGSEASTTSSSKEVTKPEDQNESFLGKMDQGISDLRDSLLDPEKGLISIVTSLVTSLGGIGKIPGKLISAFQSIFKKLMPKGSKILKNLWNKGKKLLKKIF